MPYSQSLDSVILSFNKISILENLDRAPKLSVLDLHNNKIDVLPDSILSMSALKTLNLSNNNLSDLPPRLGLMDNLVRITLEGNPLKSIKASMRNAGAEPLKKYLKMRLDENTVEEEEKRGAKERRLPGSVQEMDVWDTLLREFVQGSALDLRGKVSLKTYFCCRIWIIFLARYGTTTRSLRLTFHKTSCFNFQKRFIYSVF